tara:strand:+ start:570 stop:866 length:297 start_codon:yes stop_codon:yes gene_type:complete
MIPNKLDAISSINPIAEATIKADGSLVWHKNPTNITDEQIATKLAELQADYDAKEYQRKREKEYPTIQELVVALYDTDDKAAIDAKRTAVKAKYPKGE